MSEHVVSRHAQAQPDRQFAEELTRQIISGEADVAAAASWLQVDPARPCRVIVLSLPERYHGEARRLADLLLMYFSAYRHRVLTALSRGRVYLVASGSGAASLDIDVARDMVARAADALRLEVRGVAGPAVPTLDQAGASREHADRALQVVLRATPRSGGSVHDGADLLPSVQMMHLAEMVPGITGFGHGAVPRLQAYDAEHLTALAETLAAWLDSFGDVRVAAERLHVHPNTVRYRIRKAVAVSGIDLDDPDARLMAAVLLRAAALSKEPTR